ncbi:DUF485 domain-containing protein [Nocardiopsis halotolerans]|uniref:DUF485 domain-containing protein n=1 Tax=Nocardiopsis halotolerans TaxID=124252 RepID=UPI0004762E8A|nr:DUF485 domain-containing protein [Nocardiopsis halotolerans]
MVEYMEGAYGGRGGAWAEVTGPGGNRSAAARGRARAARTHACERMSIDPRFVKLRRRFALQSGFLVAVFLLGYLSYLLLSAYARDFMSTRVTDSVNVALVLGIGQFLLVFVLAWAFGRFSERALDPLARELRERGHDEEAADGAMRR